MKNLSVKSPFMGNYFCLIENYNLAFVAIAKNAVTYLKGVAISAKTGYIIKTEDEAHHIVGYSPLNGFLYPFDDLSNNDSIVKFAVWRDPVDRLVSCYKYFLLEKKAHPYFIYLGLYQDITFERFVDFVQFELGKENLFQDEHIRKQSDYYRPEDVDYVVSIDRLDSFLLEQNVFLDCKIKNPTHVKFELSDQNCIAKIKELYESDYQIPINY